MPNIDDEQPALTIEARPAPDGNVLVTAGELDLATAPQLSEAAEALIETGAKRLVFEVSGLSFMDSSGLRVLLELSKRAEVVLRAPSRSVRRVVESTGVDTILTLED
ncbi:MAG TPA: STAS domain-containing protein [Acidimicrobiales bacterium]